MPLFYLWKWYFMIDFVKDTQYPCLGYGTMCVVLRQLQVWLLPGRWVLREAVCWVFAGRRRVAVGCGSGRQHVMWGYAVRGRCLWHDDGSLMQDAATGRQSWWALLAENLIPHPLPCYVLLYYKMLMCQNVTSQAL